MKDIDDMRIGESFYLKMTVAIISTRTGKPCEFDEERININDLIIEELEKLKVKVIELSYDCKIATIDRYEVEKLIDRQIAELKGDNKQSRCNNCIYNDTEGLSGECYACVKGIEDWYEPIKENKE